MGQATWSVWSPDPNNESLPNPGRFSDRMSAPETGYNREDEERYAETLNPGSKKPPGCTAVSWNR